MWHVLHISALVSAVRFTLVGQSVCIGLMEALGFRGSASVLCVRHSWGDSKGSLCI